MGTIYVQFEKLKWAGVMVGIGSYRMGAVGRMGCQKVKLEVGRAVGPVEV